MPLCWCLRRTLPSLCSFYFRWLPLSKRKPHSGWRGDTALAALPEDPSSIPTIQSVTQIPGDPTSSSDLLSTRDTSDAQNTHSKAPVWVFCLHVCLFTICIPGAQEGQKTELDHLEPELQPLRTSSHARNQTCPLCKSNNCS